MEISPISSVCILDHVPRITNVEMAVVTLIEIFLFHCSASLSYVPRKWKEMRPIGELLRDDQAITAQFPRLTSNPEHYIPFRYVESGQTSVFSEAVEVYFQKLKELL